jgi:PAS domain S-box-containing protein
MIRFINHQTESLFGYDRGNLIGRPIDTLVPEDLWGIYTAHREGYFADPKTWSMGVDLELIARQRDGSEFAVHITLSPIDTGDVLVLVKSAGDVTRRRVALENAQRIAEIVRSSDDAIIAKTREGIVTSWNPAAERIFGYSSQEMLGRRMDALIPQDRASEMKAILAGLGAGQGVDHLQTVRIRKDGTPIKVSIVVSPIRDADGAVIGWAALSGVSDRCAYAGVAENSIYVHPGHHGRGVGRVLLEALITGSEEAGIWTIQTGIFPENTASITLHERCGFRIIGKRERIGRLNGVWRDTLSLERRSPTIT